MPRVFASCDRVGRGPPRAFACALILSTLACSSHPPAVHVREAQEVGTVAQSSLIVGRDGGGSALLWGRSVWTFGDTVTSLPDAQGENWHHNSFSTTPDLLARDGIADLSEPVDRAGAPAYLLAPTADEAAFNAAHHGDACQETPCGARFAAWPGTPVFDAAHSRAIIPYGLVWAAPGDFNFQGVGTGFALWSALDAAPERPVVDAASAHPTLLFGPDEPGYGTALALDGGLLHAFACAPDGLTFHCTLGRVDPGAVLDRAAWRYWDGATWSTQLAAAKPILDAASILSVQFNRRLNAWVAIYSAVMSDEVLVRTSPALTGPWSDAGTLFVADRKGHGGTTYDAQAHAEFEEEDGRVLYVTYSRSTGVGWFGGEFALVRVTLE